MKKRYQKITQVLIVILFSFNIISAQSFTTITQGLIVNNAGYSSGSTWIDYNSDGYLDMYVTNGHNQNNYLYSNNGNSTFTKINSGTIVTGSGKSHGASWADYDNDGDLDLFVANYGALNFLYKNEGNGVFAQVLGDIVTTDVGYSLGASWGDYDNDSFVDLYVVNGSGNNENFLYNNNGDGTFNKITSGTIVTDLADSRGCGWVDYNNDGNLDLFVSNYNGQNNFLYRNDGVGNFTKITSGSIVNDGGNSSGGSWSDFDNDGDLDLFVPNRELQYNFLYKNNNDESFTKVLSGNIVTDTSTSFSASWGDYDNDGFMDLFVTNGSGSYQYTDFLYMNNGDESFTKIITGDIVNRLGHSIGTCSGDYNNDGFLDIFISNNANQSNFLYLNNGNSNSWINIECIGTSYTNNSAIGTKVRLKAQIAGSDIWQTQEIRSQSGYGNQNSLNVNFGLGNATLIDSLAIYWHAADTLEILTNVNVNQFLTIHEPVVPLLLFVAPDSGFQNYSTTINITGKNTHFVDGTGVLNVWLSQGDSIINSTSYLANNNTNLQVDFDIPLYAPSGFWNIHVETDSDGIVLLNEGFKIINVPASISVNPLLIQQQILDGDSIDVNINISNIAPTGAPDLEWSSRSSILPVNKAWSIDEYNDFIINFNLNSPQLINNPFTFPNNYYLPTAGDFGIGDQSFLYVFMAYSDFIKIDTTTGVITYLGHLHPPLYEDDVWSGMSTDPTDGKIYACGSDTSGDGSLYIINPDSVSATAVGAMGGSYRMNAIAFDAEGNLWGTDTLYSSFYSIDKYSGQAQLIGYLGFPSKSYQGMAYDTRTNQLYLSSFNRNTIQAELHIIDKLTGNTTFVDRIGAYAKFLAIPGAGNQQFLNLLEPNSGTINPGNTDNLNVRLYGQSSDTSTTLRGKIEIHSNDPFNSKITVDVELNILTSIKNETGKIPQEFILSQNYPNPFNPSTKIKYDLPKPEKVKIEVFNLLGQKIEILLNKQMLAGSHEVEFTAKNLPSGVYLYRIEAGEYNEVKKMILLR